MTTYELFKFVKEKVDAYLATNPAYAGLDLGQSFQPTSQGAEANQQLAMELIIDRKIGWPQRKEIWNDANQDFDHRELRQMESDFQMSALVLEDPQQPQLPTARDILVDVSTFLESTEFIEMLEEQDMGILRVTEIRNPKFENDQSDFQASPSFDFTLTHKHITITGTKPKADMVEHDSYPI